jgi:lysyl-tRNA synthetase class 2
MNKVKPHRVARIISVLKNGHESFEVIALLGNEEHSLTSVGTPPVPGDIYQITEGNPPQLATKLAAAQTGAWNSHGDAMRWRKRDANGQSRMDVLWQRHIIRRAVRDYMDEQGFIEIDTPLLVHGTTPDATIQSFAVVDRYLITSSEMQLRRLEVGGFERAYTLTQNYRRDDGEGPTRNPEFTMLEWVRVGEDLASVERDTENLILHAHKALGGSGRIQYKDCDIDLTLPWDCMTVAEAVRSVTGAALPDFSLTSIEDAVAAAGIGVQENWKGDIYFLFSLLIDHIQPSLGLKRPVWMQDWPAFETSSAMEKAGAVAERTELFIAGVEISDGFPSFTDYERQKQTFEFQQQRRRNSKTPTVSLDDAYLESVREGMPPDAGMALGFDRLVMVLTGAADIRSTLAFAWDEV